MRVESHSEPMYGRQALYFQKIPENATAHAESERMLGGAAELVPPPHSAERRKDGPQATQQ